MIVNYTPEGWEIITQRAHGLLAAQIASYWKFTYPPNRRLDTILAITEHDDTGIEFDQEQGRSYELCQLSSDSLSICPWPFDEPRFTVAIEFRTLSKLQFTSTAEFKRALNEARVKGKVYIPAMARWRAKK